MPEGPAAGGMVKVANARVITDAALAWVARAGAERPFLLYVHFE